VRDPSVSPSWVFFFDQLLLPLPPELSVTLRMLPPWLSFDCRFLSFLVLDRRLQGRKRVWTWSIFYRGARHERATWRLPNFLSFAVASCHLFFSPYVSDSIWTIVKISWRGIYAKSFRVRRSSLDTRLVDFLENRNAFFF
jgi:hypothetical protein